MLASECLLSLHQLAFMAVCLEHEAGTEQSSKLLYLTTNCDVRYGGKCQFAHGHHELQPVMRHPKYKTEVSSSGVVLAWMSLHPCCLVYATHA